MEHITPLHVILAKPVVEDVHVLLALCIQWQPEELPFEQRYAILSRDAAIAITC